MPTEIKAQNTTTLASVKAIYDAADQANTLLDGMQAAATAAGTTLDGIYQDAADAQTAADDAQASADSASEYAARALGNLSTVQNITETLNWITAHGTMTLTSDVALDPTHVYFVVDPAGDYVVGGTHYSVVTEPDVADIATYYELSIDESLNNYVATHLAVDSEGLWIIPDAGGNKVLIATGSGSTYTTAGTYIVGKVNGVDAALASFRADGETIGINDGTQAYMAIDYHSLQLVDLDGTTFFHVSDLRDLSGDIVERFGCDGSAYQFYASYTVSSVVSVFVDNTEQISGTDYILQNGVFTIFSVPASGSVVTITYTTTAEEASIAKAFTFGQRKKDSTVGIGSYSFVTGTDNIASGNNSHAEGQDTVASGSNSHAEGFSAVAGGADSHAEGNTVYASGSNSHAEGFQTQATKNNAHAEGWGSKATGNNSHAQNNHTIAHSANQTAIGKYNVDDSNDTYALIVGNGTADNARSNALTVGWSGNVNIASGAKYKINGNNLSASDVGALAEDANGDISITRNITAGGNVTATGDVTDGAGNTLSALASALSSLIVVETKTLGTNVSVSANSTTSSYTIPSKTGYTVAAVTPMVTGSYNGQYFAAITSSNNSIPTSLYFKNTHSSAHTNSFYIRIIYIKN